MQTEIWIIYTHSGKSTPDKRNKKKKKKLYDYINIGYHGNQTIR